MKTTSLSVAYKKHVCNQTNHLKTFAIQTTTHTDDSEFQVLNLKKKDFNMNLYSLNDTALSLNALPAVEDHYLVVCDFNSHSHGWGYDHIVKRGEEVEN